jgi:DNA-directed RNA polymerase specialized sigma24 family protein
VGGLRADGPDAGRGRRARAVHARLCGRLEETAEFVDTQALAPDGPFVETKDLIAGWYIIDVESWDRALQPAGELSAAPRARRQDDLRMAGGSAVPGRLAHGHRVNEPLLRDLVPAVIGVLVRRGADFAAAEDAVQDALVEVVRVWPDDPPRDPKGWLVTVAWRKFLDAARADTSRRHREVRIEGEPMPGPGESGDDTLQLYFLCAHPSLTPASAVALTLRAVGGRVPKVPPARHAKRCRARKRCLASRRRAPTNDRVDNEVDACGGPGRQCSGRHAAGAVPVRC